MKKTMILLAGCGLLGGCMATVSPRGDVAVSYTLPVEESVYVPYSSSYVTVVPAPRPIHVAAWRPFPLFRPHRPRPIAPRPPAIVPVHPQPGGHHPGGPGHNPGGHGHHVGGNGHHPGGPGHNPGGNGHHPGGGGHNPGGNGGGGHHPQQPGTGSGHIGGQGPSHPGASVQKVPAARPNFGQIKMNR